MKLPADQVEAHPAAADFPGLVAAGVSPAVEGGILPPGPAHETSTVLPGTTGVRRAGRRGSTAGETPAATPGAHEGVAKAITRTIAMETAIPLWHSTGLYAAPGATITVTIPKIATHSPTERILITGRASRSSPSRCIINS